MAEIKWIKLALNIFNNRKIRQIEDMPDGDSILLIWIKLLCLAGNINDNGLIYLTPEVPYTEEMLATEFRRPLSTVRLALSIFKQFGMIEIIDDILCLPSWERYQNVDRMNEIREYNRLAQKRSREKKKQKLLESADVNDKSMTSQSCQGTDIDIEEDIDIDIDTLSNSLSKKRRAREKGKEESKTEANVQNSVENSKLAMSYLGGSLGEGVVLISEEQAEDLLARLTLDEFNHYVGVVRDSVLKGRRYGKTHYKAILDMAEADRAISRPKAAGGG